MKYRLKTQSISEMLCHHLLARQIRKRLIAKKKQEM